MATKKKELEKKFPPALTPEMQENQMISMANDLAAKQLQEGTASSQIITHFLKMGSCKERLEIEKLKQETELIKAKVAYTNSVRDSEESLRNALEAFKRYSGNADDESDDYGEY